MRLLDPPDLEEVSNVNGVIDYAERRQLTWKVWPAATAEDPLASDMCRRDLAIAQLKPQSAFEIADLIAVGSMGAAKLGKAPQGESREIGFAPEVVATGGLQGKLAKVAARAETVGQIRRPEALSGRANVLSSCELSLKRLAKASDFGDAVTRRRADSMSLPPDRRCWRGRPTPKQDGLPSNIYRTWKERSPLLDTASFGRRGRSRKQPRVRLARGG